MLTWGDVTLVDVLLGFGLIVVVPPAFGLDHPTAKLSRVAAVAGCLAAAGLALRRGSPMAIVMGVPCCWPSGGPSGGSPRCRHLQYRSWRAPTAWRMLSGLRSWASSAGGGCNARAKASISCQVILAGVVQHNEAADLDGAVWARPGADTRTLAMVHGDRLSDPVSEKHGR
jgi:hypothetical protein